MARYTKNGEVLFVCDDCGELIGVGEDEFLERGGELRIAHYISLTQDYKESHYRCKWCAENAAHKGTA